MKQVADAIYSEEQDPQYKIIYRFSNPSLDFIKLDFCMKREVCLQNIQNKILNFINNIPFNNLDLCLFGIQFIDIISERMINENYFSKKHLHFINYHISVMLLRAQMIYCDFREKKTNLKTIISILKELKIQSRQLEFSVIKALMKNNTNGKVNEWVYILKNIKDKYHNVLQMFIMEIKQFY